MNRGSHEDVLRAPAWDAQLADVEDQVFQAFEINRKRHGGFLLLIQTPEWEFMTGVGDGAVRPFVGAITLRRIEMPPHTIDRAVRRID